MNHKRTPLSIAGTLALLLALSACGESEPPETITAADAPAADGGRSSSRSGTDVSTEFDVQERPVGSVREYPTAGSTFTALDPSSVEAISVEQAFERADEKAYGILGEALVPPIAELVSWTDDSLSQYNAETQRLEPKFVDRPIWLFIYPSIPTIVFGPYGLEEEELPPSDLLVMVDALSGERLHATSAEALAVAE